MEKFKFHAFVEEWSINNESRQKEIILQAIAELPLEKLKALFNVAISSSEDLILNHEDKLGHQCRMQRQALIRGWVNIEEFKSPEPLNRNSPLTSTTFNRTIPD